MAQVTSVTMHRPEWVEPGLARVTVEYRATFEEHEVGLPHRVTVELWAKDDLTVPAPFARPLYTFTFGSFFGRRPSKVVAPGAAEFADTVTNLLQRTVLDEDPGWDGFVPEFDEVYARVVVSREAVALSPVQSFSAVPAI